VVEKFNEGLKVRGMGREVRRSFKLGGWKRERCSVLVRYLGRFRRLDKQVSMVISFARF